MPNALILWGHALAALLFAVLALAQLRSRAAPLPRLSFVVALALTSLWALAVAGIDARDISVRMLESARNLAWLGFMFTLMRREREAPAIRAVAGIYGVVALVIVIGIGLAVTEESIGANTVPVLTSVRLLLRLMTAVAALVLVDHLRSAVAPSARGGIRLAVIALAAMWGIDSIIYADAYMTGEWPTELIAGRGVVMALAAPVFALAVQRNGDWTLQLSRTVAWQTVSVAATLLYGAAMLLGTGAIGAIGGSHGRVLQTAFVFGSTAAALTLLSSPWLRAWAKVKLAKHLFRHRYDYRHEWLRFTNTLGKPGEGAPSLAERVVKAVADLTDSPGGLLLVPDGQRLVAGANWQWPDAPDPDAPGSDEPLAAFLAATGRIVEIDAVRAGRVGADEANAVPPPIVAHLDAWALVPLIHLERLQGAILLARPPIDRPLDWEDFDLLRVAGRQLASYLAEAQAQGALAEAQRFDEFNRRFAFIMHDIKNLVSQLSLVARNAERHAENPAFRADMIATLQDSAGRMNGLLARLSQHHTAAGEPPRAVPVLALAAKLAERRRGQYPIDVRGDAAATALADPARLEQVLDHLLQNAIEASASGCRIALAVEADAGGVRITVADQGCGMSAAFVRDRLFKPFVSSKPGGFGIGAFEARQLVDAMGGAIAVESRESEGTRFTITLPAAVARTLEHAA